MIDPSKRYISDKSCPYGHIPWSRYKSSGECCECVAERVGRQRHAGKRQTVNRIGIYVRALE